ncbi:hypothetical protein CQ10_40815 [Bradyrhizobium valentinum]|uniref:Uncharacterized protein n=2 Tax=Bradyrhizobium valentinum TaxID=1518501 RepID=A0A0R3LUI0_9BRAD|nr:hypothetical protein CQ10_40815 [Bradyrhizobium valentinum]KRR11626.1 hypothetical protein CP49_40825 [Bradyrhizobium valentinum]
MFRNEALEVAFTPCMRDPIKEPKYWRDRAEATRTKAKQLRCYNLREMQRMLRVAEEYDRLADLAANWQSNSQLIGGRTPRED